MVPSVQRDILFNFFNFPDSQYFGNKLNWVPDIARHADGEKPISAILNATSLILISQ
jgi:hypothetical protein